jgi:adenylate cyclase
VARRILGWGGPVAALVLAIGFADVLGAPSLQVLATPSLQALNLLFSLRGPREPRSPIVVVTIDEDSFDELDLQWPWPRELHGRFLDIVRRGQPIAVGLDIVFSEPSGRGAADDRAFGAAIARAGNVVLAAAPTETMTPAGPKTDPNLPLPELRQGAVGFGPVNYPIDTDANVRRAVLAYPLGGERLRGFVWHLYQLGVKAGIPAQPLPEGDSFLINYRGGPGTYPRIPYYRLLNGEVAPETVRGKIVLVGATTPILHDVFSTPFASASSMPGVEIHAHALETLFRGIPLRQTPRAVTAALAVVMAFGSVWITTALRPLRALVLLAAAWLVMGGMVLALFTRWHTWVDAVAPTLALGLGYIVTVVVDFVNEQRQRRRLSRFFSPAVLKEIVHAKSDLSLGSSRRLLTVLFSDIRGFTAMSERLPPEQVAELLGEYLTELTEVVFKHGGTVDKYVGDCIMALYNVPFEHPDHAVQAVRTALEFQERTRALSERWEAKVGVRVANGVGINTGEAVVGTLGSRQRLEYTAIGDTVNLAARLESITKDFHSPIIVSESTHALLHGEFPSRALGEVTVKGKEVPVKIYAVLTSDTRKDERAPADLAVKVMLEELTVDAVANDVSVSGLSVRLLPLALASGRIVRLRLDGAGLGQPLVSDARVVWCRQDTAGFAFVEAAPDVTTALADYVARARAAPTVPVA